MKFNLPTFLTLILFCCISIISCKSKIKEYRYIEKLEYRSETKREHNVSIETLKAGNDSTAYCKAYKKFYLAQLSADKVNTSSSLTIHPIAFIY